MPPITMLMLSWLPHRLACTVLCLMLAILFCEAARTTAQAARYTVEQQRGGGSPVETSHKLSSGVARSVEASHRKGLDVAKPASFWDTVQATASRVKHPKREIATLFSSKLEKHLLTATRPDALPVPEREIQWLLKLTKRLESMPRDDDAVSKTIKTRGTGADFVSHLRHSMVMMAQQMHASRQLRIIPSSV